MQKGEQRDAVPVQLYVNRTRASEYGIRMEAIRFDTPFCLHSRPLVIVIHLFLVIRSSYVQLTLPFLAGSRESNENAVQLRRRCMRIENAISCSALFLAPLGPLAFPLFLLDMYRCTMYVISMIRYKILRARARISHEIACEQLCTPAN